MLIRHCGCGTNIRLRDSICKKCREKYGNDSTKWPEWLSFLVKQEQSEINRQRRHDFEHFIDEEYYLPDYRTTVAKHIDKDIEEMSWRC